MRDGVSTFQAQTWMGWRSVVWTGAGRQEAWKLARHLLAWSVLVVVSMAAKTEAGSRHAARQSAVKSSWGWVAPD